MTVATNQHEFDDEGFLTWLNSVLRRVGGRIFEQILVVYYVAVDPKTPIPVRTALFGVLAYCAFPLDAIPDAIPVAGLTDDASLLVGAITGYATSIRPRHYRKARRQMRLMGWEPDVDTGEAAA